MDYTLPETTFKPPKLLSGPHIQSLIASSQLRKNAIYRAKPEVLARSRIEVLDLGEDDKLQIHRSDHPQAKARVMLFHGWEGSVDSTYLLDAARHLYDNGYSVIRLNFRDHGQTHNLSRGIFHSCRLPEVVAAYDHVAAENQQLPMFLAGFSLGGNFTLRVARDCQYTPDHSVAVSPVITPFNVMRSIESAPWFYQVYFSRKWRKSLRAKQALYPELYDFEPLIKQSSLGKMTEDLVENYTEFDRVLDYLDAYAVHDGRLLALTGSATILTAKDDPVIPIGDFDGLQLGAQTKLMITDHGGHCGFIDRLQSTSWVSAFLVDQFNTKLKSKRHSGNPLQHDRRYASAETV